MISHANLGAAIPTGVPIRNLDLRHRRPRRCISQRLLSPLSGPTIWLPNVWFYPFGIQFYGHDMCRRNAPPRPAERRDDTHNPRCFMNGFGRRALQTLGVARFGEWGPQARISAEMGRRRFFFRKNITRAIVVSCAL
jgi:hypothetical protein